MSDEVFAPMTPPTPPDLGMGILVTFDFCRTTSQYRAKIHDGHACATFAGLHATSYGEALTKAINKRKTALGIVTNNIVNKIKPARPLNSERN